MDSLDSVADHQKDLRKKFIGGENDFPTQIYR